MQRSQRFLTLIDSINPSITEINCDQLQDYLNQGLSFELLDIREQSEFDGGAIQGARHLSKGIIERDIEAQIPDLDRHIVLYCSGGFRSQLSADNLQKMGYSKVESLKGGYKAWIAANSA